MSAHDSPNQVAATINVGDAYTVVSDGLTGVVRNSSGSEILRFRLEPLPQAERVRRWDVQPLRTLVADVPVDPRSHREPSSHEWPGWLWRSAQVLGVLGLIFAIVLVLGWAFHA